MYSQGNYVFEKFFELFLKVIIHDQFYWKCSTKISMKNVLALENSEVSEVILIFYWRFKISIIDVFPWKKLILNFINITDIHKWYQWVLLVGYKELQFDNRRIGLLTLSDAEVLQCIFMYIWESSTTHKIFKNGHRAFG